MNHYYLLRTKIDSGKRLTILVDDRTFIPVPLPTIWASTYEDYVTSTITSKLTDIKLLYEWAAGLKIEVLDGYPRRKDNGNFDLDAFLYHHNEQVFDFFSKHMSSLQAYLKNSRAEWKSSKTVTKAVFLTRRSNVAEFLAWSIACVRQNFSEEYRKRYSSTDEAVLVEQLRIKHLFSSNISLREGASIHPLTSLEAKDLLGEIAPIRHEENYDSWEFEHFAERTGLRNWLMLTMCLTMGIPIGGLLKICVEDVMLERKTPQIFFEDRSSDVLDTRIFEPSNANLPSKMPIPSRIIDPLRFYIEGGAKSCRPTSFSPYLFLSDPKKPMSYGAANDIMRRLKPIVKMDTLNWQMLYTTWQETQKETALYINASWVYRD